MNTKSEIIQKLRKAKPELQKNYPFSELAIFGSYARDDFSSESDIDILISINGKIGSRFIELALELEKLLGKKVDLVSHKGIKSNYLESIKEDLIYV